MEDVKLIHKALAAAVSKKHDELIARTIAKDASSLRAMFHPEFVSVGGFDKSQEAPPPLHSADDELAGLSKLKLESNEIKKFRVVSVGQVAIATGFAHTKGTYDGKDISGVYPFVQVWTLNPARIQAGVTSFAEAAESDLMLAACFNIASANV